MFHYAASNVVSLYQAGKHTEAKKMLYSQFESFSTAVQKDLEMLHSLLERLPTRR